MVTSDISMILPRVLIVSRRTVRKKKFVDFVGEYHLDLIVRYGAVPVIIPRVSGVHMQLESFEPIHGVLLCEGEDIDPSLYDAELTEKDSIELRLAKLCLKRNIPYLGICRGSQVLNVACGGTLYQDVEKELSKICTDGSERVSHLNYEDYDGHRHAVGVVEDTPLHHWFEDSLEDEKMEIMVNSYHHQGVKRLARRFVPMAFAPDSLVEGFYDPDAYNPKEGKFITGLQFHPERMRHPSSDNFDYPGCSSAYQEFVKAVIAHEKKLNCSAYVSKARKLNQELIAGSEFLEANTALSLQQENRLKQMGATVRNSSMYLERLIKNEERERVARIIMEKMSIEQLSDLMSLYQMMGRKCSEELEKKLQDLMKEEN
ncbi:hypothetical protein ACB098_08G129200 [Castanea mollissima]